MATFTGKDNYSVAYYDISLPRGGAYWRIYSDVEESLGCCLTFTQNDDFTRRLQLENDFVSCWETLHSSKKRHY